MSPALMTGSAENSTGIHILHTAVNPSNNHTYHLLSASSWEDAAEAANGLDDSSRQLTMQPKTNGCLIPLRILKISLDICGLDCPILKRMVSINGMMEHHFITTHGGNLSHPKGGDEDYVHIAGTNIGNILPGTWNDLNNNPETCSSLWRC